MKIEGGHIGGFGRLQERTFELNTELQVIFGPNEQGKSTLRAFLIDMLYGQRENLLLPQMMDTADYRKPWTNGTGYGGRLTYYLDNGSRFEVERDFKQGPEATHIRENGSVVDAARMFPPTLGGEYAVAEHHLGLPKRLFLAAATIEHGAPDDFGPDSVVQALSSRLAAIADTGQKSLTAADALAMLEAYAQSIGNQGAPADRPLRQLNKRRAALEAQLEEYAASYSEAESLANGLTSIRNRLALARAEAETIERRLTSHRHAAEVRRVEEADRLSAEIANATKVCFGLSAARDVNLDRVPDVLRVETRVTTARAEVERTRAQLKKAQERYETEHENLGESSSNELLEDSWEERIATAEAAARSASERLDGLEREARQIELRMEETGELLEQLPDFSTLASDPMLWLNQLANTFDIHRQSRDAEEERCDRIRRELAEYAKRIEGPVEVFERMDDVIAETRQYEVDMRVADEQVNTLRAQEMMLEPAIEELRASVPAYAAMAGVTTLLAGGLAAVVWFVAVPGVAVPLVLSGVLLGYYVLNTVYARGAARAKARELARVIDSREKIEQESNERRESMKKWLDAAKCDGPRELAGYYESFRQDSEHYNALKDRLNEQEELLDQTRAHVRKLYGQVCSAIESAGESVMNEDDVATGAARAIGRYQEYRDAKRRHADARVRARELEVEIEQAKQDVKEAEQADVECSLALRGALRDRGFRDESKHTRASLALRAYRIRAAQAESRRGRTEVLQEKLVELQRQLEIEEQDRQQLEEEFNRQLAHYGVGSAEEWHELIDQAREYQEAWEKRTSAQRELEIILGGEDLEVIRERCEAVDGEGAQGDPNELQADLEPLLEAIEAIGREERDREVALAEHLAALPDKNAIEEELARVKRSAEALEGELEAVGHAAATIEQVATRMHGGLAPILSDKATEFYRLITQRDDALIEVRNDFELRTRIPETGEVRSDFVKVLSRGALDQVYFSLRLALAQALSQTGERVPLLFDDPFSNYDDDRLDRAMHLLQAVSKENQVLLFTCRNDVAEAAKRSGAAILEL